MNAVPVEAPDGISRPQLGIVPHYLLKNGRVPGVGILRGWRSDINTEPPSEPGGKFFGGGIGFVHDDILTVTDTSCQRTPVPGVRRRPGGLSPLRWLLVNRVPRFARQALAIWLDPVRQTIFSGILTQPCPVAYCNGVHYTCGGFPVAVSHVHVSGRLIEGTLSPCPGGWLIRCGMSEWEDGGIITGAEVEVDSPHHRDLRLRVEEVTEWVAGEPVAFVRLVDVPKPTPAIPTSKRPKRRGGPTVTV